MASFQSTSEVRTDERVAIRTPTKIYSVPRRYDLATLFVIVLAYALLFAAMRLMRWQPEFALLIGLFFSVIGLGQAVLFKGTAPRQASLVIGMVFLPVCTLMMGVIYGLDANVFGIVFFTAVLGAVLGYFAGVLIGGVFLVAEPLRRQLRKPIRR